jgi:hypothetical protein
MGDGITFGEFVRGVDELCADPANGILPILEITDIFTAKVHGASEAAIKARLERQREWYSRPVPPPQQKTGGKQQ